MSAGRSQEEVELRASSSRLLAQSPVNAGDLVRKAKLADQAVVNHLIIPTCSQQQSVTKREKVRCLFEQKCVYVQIFKLRRLSDPPET